MVVAEDLVAVTGTRLGNTGTATAKVIIVLVEIEIGIHGSSEVEGERLKVHRLFFFFLF